jgi:hypothetical protein
VVRDGQAKDEMRAYYAGAMLLRANSPSFRGADLVWTWCGPGVDLVRTWCGPCLAVRAGGGSAQFFGTSSRELLWCSDARVAAREFDRSEGVALRLLHSGRQG